MKSHLIKVASTISTGSLLPFINRGAIFIKTCCLLFFSSLKVILFISSHSGLPLLCGLVKDIGLSSCKFLSAPTPPLVCLL
ncbi:MAG: hypothetical protein MK240_01025, partial [Opitutales bacterium]|nr:hypothetical protein [Opitutales bacterium]